MIRATLTTILLVQLLGGCNAGKPSIRELDLGGPIGSANWRSPLNKSVQPGIDQGSVYYVGKRLLLWSDTSIHVHGNQQNESLTGEGYLYGPGVDPHNPELKFDFKFTGSLTKGSGTINVAGKSYDLSKGAMFLLTLSPEGPRVKQLNQNLSKLKFDHFSLQELGKAKPEIKDFFTHGDVKPND